MLEKEGAVFSVLVGVVVTELVVGVCLETTGEGGLIGSGFLVLLQADKASIVRLVEIKIKYFINDS
jgi:hypothetical protein